MPFDDAKWGKAAIQGDLGAVAAATKFALDTVRVALQKLKDGEPIDELLDGLAKQSKWLDEIANDLTGYTPDDD